MIQELLYQNRQEFKHCERNPTYVETGGATRSLRRTIVGETRHCHPMTRPRSRIGWLLMWSSNMTATAATTAEMLPAVAWHISTRSDGVSGNRVEAGPVLDGSDRVAVRHSHAPHGPVLIHQTDNGAAFLTGVREGRFG